ncbi:hypothetical protein D3C81_905840 [compost metagenome]
MVGITTVRSNTFNRPVRINHPLREATLAKRFIRQALNDRTRLIRHRRRRTQVITVEVAHRRHRPHFLDQRNDLTTRRNEVLVNDATISLEILLIGQPTYVIRVQVDGGRARRNLFDPLMLRTVRKRDTEASSTHGLRHTKAGVDLRPTLVGNHIVGRVVLHFIRQRTIGVIRISAFTTCGKLHFRDRMRTIVDATIGVGTHIGAAGDVADRVVAIRLRYQARTRRVDCRIAQTVEAVVEEGFIEVLGRIATAEQVTNAVIAVREVLYIVTRPCIDVREAIRTGLVDLLGDDAVTVGLLQQMTLCILRVSAPE